MEEQGDQTKGQLQKTQNQNQQIFHQNNHQFSFMYIYNNIYLKLVYHTKMRFQEKSETQINQVLATLYIHNIRILEIQGQIGIIFEYKGYSSNKVKQIVKEQLRKIK